MKAGYSDLIPLVQSATSLPRAQCFTLALPPLDDVTILRYTDLDVPVWYKGDYYAANAVRISGLKMKQTTGVDIDEQTIDFIYGPTDTVKGVPWAQAIRQRILDGCFIQRDQVFFDPENGWPPPWTGAVAAGGVTMFYGRVSTVTNFGRTMAQVNVKSNLALLDIDYPRNLWQPNCLHTLYDSGCGLSRGAYQNVLAAGAGGTYTEIPVTLGGSGAVLGVTMSGTGYGAPISRVVVTSAAAVNQGYITAPPVTLTDPTGSGAVLRAVVSPFGSGLYAIQVVNAGHNYTNPTITIGAGSAGTATAEAVLKAGSLTVSGVNVVSKGEGYGNATQIVLAGGGGTGATAVPVISGGQIQNVVMQSNGIGYSAVPTADAVDDAFTNYAQGSLLFQGGQNAGTMFQVKSSSPTSITLAYPLDYLPAEGDVFSIWPGCDHTPGAGGCAKFNNLVNFRGFPKVPPPLTTF